MSTDYEAWEREFLASLKEDTGRDLDGWMAYISAQCFSDKNDIIDWLRQQGFMFSKASWLERVHHNGGKPVYGGGSEQRPVVPATAAMTTPVPEPPPPAVEPKQVADAPPAERVVPPQPASLDANLDALFAKAKALRPLAQFILKEAANVVPGMQMIAKAQYVSLVSAREFGVLIIGPRELKLGLALGDHPTDTLLKPARFVAPSPRVSAAITHMITLSDARQVNQALVSAVKLAAQANS